MKVFSTILTRLSGSGAPLCCAALLTAVLLVPASIFAQPPPQPPVNLLSAANFAILSGAAITNVPRSTIIGDVGASPITAAAIAGFGLTEIEGTIYVVDDAYPIANVAVIDTARLNAAKDDLTLAYNEAAGRTPVPTGDFLNPGAGNLGGMTLGPGLYKFTDAALITGTDLILRGSANAVWIFQIGTALTVGSDIRVILAGGAQAGNIFWQVGTSAALGVGSVMQGTILADQTITLATHATLSGRALARIAGVTLQMNSITRPPLAFSPNATPVPEATWGETKNVNR